MKLSLTHIVLFLCFCLTQLLYSQEDGVVAFDLPVRNSLKFNRYTINPTFSFVREQNKYLSFTNKREWVEFDNAPETYLFSYSGRFRENIGLGLGLFQQNYGVLTTFGGIANFAYNVVINRDSNLTFGTNIGFYKSGINDGEVITNFPDPSLDNFPSNSLLTINPGINYGTEFLDFGVSINNLVSYNLTTSKIIEDNPEQSIQGHIMYTGYFNSRGFFDESKFSGLFISELKKDKTVLSGIMMVTVPKGIWAQVGYNTLYGASAGLGLNITKQIALEYNFEKSIGDLNTFGNSHEITLAYKFTNKNRFNYSGDDDEEALVITYKKSKPVRRPNIKPTNKSKVKVKEEVIKEDNAEDDAQDKLAEEAKIKADAVAKAKLEEEARARLAKEQAKAKLEEEQRLAKIATDIKAKKEAEAKQLAEAKARAKAAEETKAKLAEEERLAKLAAEIKANEEAKAKELAEAEAKAKADAEAQAKLEEERLAKLAAEAKSLQEENTDSIFVPNATDANAKSIEKLTKLTDNSKIEQQELLDKLTETIANKQKDLDDLKEENDLSEQGIVRDRPKVFKSVSAENAALESLQVEIDNIIESQNLKISELETLYNERLKDVPDQDDSVNVFYLRKIQGFKTQQKQVMQAKSSLLSKLENIKEATEIERKRRIKRAAYDNQEARYLKDKAALNLIKQTTQVSSVPLTEADFDFGERQSNIQIIKDVKNVESGYYLVIAVHNDVSKRDEFLTKTVSSGQSDVNFFYDVSTSKYFIYYKKFDDIESARSAIESKGNEPYNSKMSIVKIEN